MASREYETVMFNGDYVDVQAIDKLVGPGRIVDATVDPAKVIVRRPSGGDYQVGASRSFLKPAGPGRWHLNMPAAPSREFR